MPAPDIPVRVWDLPTRVFHWVLAACVVGSFVSAKVGGNAMVLHFRLGYVVLALLLFRLLWGVVGGRWSRFSSFSIRPSALLRYLRGQGRPEDRFQVGHSPLGSLAVLGLLGVLLLQVATGLVADDEIANVGPLNRLVSTEWAGRATHWHKEVGQALVLGLVGLHLLAIAVYRFVKRMNLVGPMLGGDKALPPDTPASADGAAQRLLAVVLVLCCGAAVVGMVTTLGS